MTASVSNKTVQTTTETMTASSTQSVMLPLSDYMLMHAIKYLEQAYNASVHDPYNLSQEYQQDGVNPMWGQTEQGIFLEFSGDVPWRLWTPWGLWHFGAAKRYQIDMDQFLSHLSLQLHHVAPKKWGFPGGPVFAVTAVDDFDLPEPSVPDEPHRYYSISRRDWNQLYQEVSV